MVYGPPPQNNTSFYNPKALVFGSSDAQLFVNNGGPSASPTNNSFTGIANVSAGTYSNVYGGAGSSLSAPYSIAYDGTRYLYAGNSNNSITRFDTTAGDITGTKLTLNPGAGAPNNIATLNGLAVGPDGALYATDGARGQVLRMDAPNTSASTFTIFSSGLVGPEGIAFEPGTNSLFVANDDDTIRRIIPVGNVISGFLNGIVDPSYLVQEAVGSGPTFLAFSPIPEPSTYALFGVAGLVVLTIGWRRREQITFRA